VIHPSATSTKSDVYPPEKFFHAKPWLVVGMTAIATTIGWYSFFIFGSLTAAIGPAFFPKGHSRLAEFSSLISFAIAFVARPFGAFLFGRKGDRDGRKAALVRSSLILGVATAGIGIMPRYQSIGAAAPIVMILLRILQGLALGGQHGIVSVYVAELVQDKKIGFWTSFIQATVIVGLLASFAVIYALQATISPLALFTWGWRIPFILASALIVLSIYFNRSLPESPVFLSESAGPSRLHNGKKSVWKLVLLAVFGATAGQGVLWYTSQFHTQFFLQEVLRVKPASAISLFLVALLLSLPFFVFFGWLSDKVGPRKIVIVGCLFAALSLFPIYRGMAAATRDEAISIRMMKNPSSGGVKLTPVSPQANGTLLPLNVADNPKIIALSAIVFIQALIMAMVSGPIAAYLVKLFPANIRCVSLSLSYQLGNSVFGSALPVVGLSLISSTSSIYGGLFYPAGILLLTFIVGFFTRVSAPTTDQP